MFAALFASAAQAAKFTSAEPTHIEEPRPADVPSDAAMEAAGATIGAIELVFRPPRLLNLPALNLYRIAIDAPLRQALSLSRADLAAAMLASINDRDCLSTLCKSPSKPDRVRP